MKTNNINSGNLKDLISKGLDLTFKKLLKQKQAINGTFAFSENGKIIKVKARDIKS